jgi:hypothetical protein
MSLNKTREEMMAILAESLQTADPNDRHKPLIRTTEDFWGKDITEAWKNGIWLCGECGYTYKGGTAFAYYNDSSKNYHGGILRSFMKLLSKNGWHAEWYDPGTVFIFQELHQNP